MCIPNQNERTKTVQYITIRLNCAFSYKFDDTFCDIILEADVRQKDIICCGTSVVSSNFTFNDHVQRKEYGHT